MSRAQPCLEVTDDVTGQVKVRIFGFGDIGEQNFDVKGRVPPFLHITVSRFLQQQPHHYVSLRCSIFRYSGNEILIPKHDTFLPS